MARSTTFPDLSARRLLLRRIVPDDAVALHAALGDADCMRHWSIAASTSIDETRQLIDRWLGKITSPYEHLAWAVTLRRGGRCIGMVNYHNRNARNRRLEIGYVVAPAEQGKGYGGEAVAALVDHCEGALGAHRVDALIDPGNAASVALVTRLGFRCEGGPLTDYWCVGSRFMSPMIYARVGRPGAAAV